MSAQNGPAPSRRWLRVVSFVAPALLLLALLTVALARSGGAPRVGDEAPPFAAPLLEGEGTLGLDELRGRPVVLNFWASWCGPCRDEAPLLRAAHETYGDEVAFVGVNIRDSVSDARNFVEEYQLPYPDVRDEGGRIEKAYGLTGQPETFFISADGAIAEHLIGPIPDEETLMRLVASLED